MPGTAERPYLDKAAPEAYAALTAAARACGRFAQEVGVGRDLVELVEARVSQVNGCVACLSIHLPAARAAGVDPLLLDVLPAWRDADGYDPRQRAALALAEALTSPHAYDLAAAQREAALVLATDEVAAIEWVVVVINAFNRVSIASGHPPRRPRGAAGAGPR